MEKLGALVTIDHSSLAEIETNLLTKLPVVACVHTADLSYWSQAVDHVVVVVGVDGKQVYMNDPSLNTGQQPIPRLPTRRVGRKLREIRRKSLDLNAKMNALMQETLNINGALLVKLFGR